jgi:hypothetical protein
MSIAKGLWSFVDRGRPKDLKNMSERLCLDRRSFKQFLSALFQQIQRQGLRVGAGDRIDPQWVPDLIQIRQEVKSGRVDLSAVTNRLVKLTQRIVGGGGAGVWLFANDEIFYSAGAGSASNDERLRLEVISKLATSCRLSYDSQSRLGRPTTTGTVYDVSCSPGCTKSLLVAPIYQGRDIAGALAAFSDELNAFTECDTANIHFLADVLAQALSKAAEAGLEHGVALESTAMLQLIERIIPALQRMLETDLDARHSTYGFPQSIPEHELPTTGIVTKPLQESHESGQEARATKAMGGTRTGHDQELPAPPGDSANSPALAETTVPGIGVPGSLESEVVETSTLWPAVQQKSEGAVALVRDYVLRTLKVARLAGCWFLNRAEEAGHKVWHTARYRIDPPFLPLKAIYRRVQRIKASRSRAVQSTRNRLRSAAEYRLDLPTVQSRRNPPALPKVAGQRDLCDVQYSFLHALKGTNIRLQTLLQSRPSRRALRRKAPVLAILVIMITFLVLKTGLRSPAHTTASNSHTTAQGKTIPINDGTPGYRETVQSMSKSGTGEAPVTEAFRTSVPLQVSHMQVTDRTTEDAVRTLSRYELAGLRRRAVYGDDSAVFQMGMAYEIGRGVPQSCTTAAQWVARAAAEGNVAAQYNLGLRYRDGDGVPVNEDEAVKWLQRAAAQKSSDALFALTEHQAGFVASRP